MTELELLPLQPGAGFDPVVEPAVLALFHCPPREVLAQLCSAHGKSAGHAGGSTRRESHLDSRRVGG